MTHGEAAATEVFNPQVLEPRLFQMLWEKRLAGLLHVERPVEQRITLPLNLVLVIGVLSKIYC